MDTVCSVFCFYSEGNNNQPTVPDAAAAAALFDVSLAQPAICNSSVTSALPPWLGTFRSLSAHVSW